MKIPKIVEEFKDLAMRRQKLAAQCKTATGAEFARLTAAVFDLDVVIGVLLETHLSDSLLRVTTTTKVNDVGEITGRQTFVLGAEDADITYQDLWAMKILKPALSPNNVEIIPKKIV